MLPDDTEINETDDENIAAEGEGQDEDQSLESVIEAAFEADGGIDDGADDDAEKAGPSRDASGRFAKKSQDDEDDAAGKAAKAAAEAADVGGTPSSPPSDGVPASVPAAEAETAAAAASAGEGSVVPPQHWSQADKDFFAGKSEEDKAWLMGRYKDMEADYTRKSQSVAPILNTLSPYQGYFNQIGVTPEVYIDALAKTEATLRLGTQQEKMAMIRSLALDYGIIKDGQELPLGGGAPAAPQADPRDPYGLGDAPVNGAASPENQALEDRVNRMERAAQMANRDNMEAARVEGQQSIDSFIAEKNGDGTIKNKYFDRVVPQLTALANIERASGRVPILSDLYDKAIWADASIRKELLATQQSQAKGEAREQKKSLAQRSKRAGKNVSGSPSTTPRTPAKKDQSLEDIIRDAAEEHGL